jgi:hypothetical protein
MTDDSTLDKLSNLIDEAFDKVFGRGNDIEEIKSASPVEELPKTPALYESIEDYTAKTGKRFRMTKEQKNLGLTRDEAFFLTYGDKK